MKLDKIDQWKKLRKKSIIEESIASICLIAFIILGIFFDCSQDSIGPLVENLDTVSLTVLQIQASVSAISIAILALVGGFVSDEYYGVSLTNYFLNIRPCFLKQKILICGLLGLEGINICCHLYSLYNVVIAISWGSCFLVIISVIELYGIFNGKKRIYEEIDCYIEYILFGEKIKLKKRYEVFSGFTGAWSEKTLNTIDHDACLQRYKKVISIILQEDEETALGVIGSEAANIIKRQTALLDKSKLYRAYEVFDETYLSIWMHILSKNCVGIAANFTLYEDCVDEVISLINTIDTDDLSSNVSWRRTTDNIIRVKIYCNQDKDNIKKMPDERALQSINWIVTTLGHSLAERRRKGDVISSRRWEFNSSRYYYYANIPEDVLPIYRKNQCKLEFSYYYALLRNGMTDIVATVFDNSMNYTRDNSYEEILFILLVLSYTYYIGERETLACVPEEEKGNAKHMLTKWKNDEFLQSIVSDIAWHKPQEVLDGLEDDFDSILDHYERMPIDGGCKSCIINGVARDFYLFFISYLVGICRREDIIEGLFSEQKAKNYYYQYLGNSTEATKGRLLQILSSFSDKNESKLALEEGFELVNTVILKNYKSFIIKESCSNYDKFLNEQNDILLRDRILEQLNNCISEWTFKPDKNSTIIRRVLLRCTMPVELVDLESIEQFKSNLEGNMLITIISDLYRSGRIKKFIKTKNNDDQYISLLEREKLKYIIGPDYDVNMSSYKNRKKYDEFILLNNMTRKSIGGCRTGLVLADRIGVEILDVTLHFSNVNLSDVTYEVNPENGMLKCAEVAGDVEFTREELVEYLHKEKTVMNISVKLNYQLPSGNLGYLVNRELKEDI